MNIQELGEEIASMTTLASPSKMTSLKSVDAAIQLNP